MEMDNEKMYTKSVEVENVSRLNDGQFQYQNKKSVDVVVQDSMPTRSFSNNMTCSESDVSAILKLVKENNTIVKEIIALTEFIKRMFEKRMDKEIEDGVDGNKPSSDILSSISEIDVSAVFTFVEENNRIVKDIKKQTEFIKDRMFAKEMGKEIEDDVDGNKSSEILPSVDTINERLTSIINTCESLAKGIKEYQNKDVYVRKMQDELYAYKEDMCLKLLRKYVIDINIELFKQIAYRNYDLDQNGEKNIELEKVEKRILQYLETIGVSNKSTKEGGEYVEEYMTVSNYPSLETTDSLLSEKVARSIIPKFFWILPTVQNKSTPLVLNKEEVILYEYKNGDSYSF